MNINLLLMLVVLSSSGGNAILRREYRIPLPYTAEEYRIGHLWSTWEWSIRNTGGGEGVEVVTNEPYEHDDGEKGQFTHKIYHLASKVPRVIRMLAPKGALEIHEESWNHFPETKTVLSNPDYMKDGFHVTTYTKVVSASDCKRDNVLPIFSDVDVVHIDIVNDPVSSGDYSEDEDPTKCETGRETLSSKWKKDKVGICVYKLVEAEFKWFGLQDTVESRVQKVCPRLFRNLHRQMFCWRDEWKLISMETMRELEPYLKDELDKKRSRGKVQGMSES